jgi:hypothetical protein
MEGLSDSYGEKADGKGSSFRIGFGSQKLCSFFFLYLFMGTHQKMEMGPIS